MSEFLLIIYLLILPYLQIDTYMVMRKKMVKEQIISRGIRDPAVLKAMEKVPRHCFVSPGVTDYAYDDRPLSIGYDQTISQPYIVAYMTEIIHPKNTDKVLEIGTGSGYQAAILAEIVKQVYTIEIIEPLGLMARNTLNDLGYKNIEVKIGDGYNGWKEHSPFDGIIVTAAAESIPKPLIDQLNEGGRMIIPIGPQHSVQSLILIEKTDGKIKETEVLPVRFVPFIHKE